MRFVNRWAVGDWMFYQVEGLNDFGTLFTYSANTVEATSDPERHTGELYGLLEYAMAAAIAEKYTGRRGAGGTGVGTAADWFMRMIGAPLDV